MSLAVLLAVTLSGTPAEPSATQVATALELLTQCDGPAVADVLSRADLTLLDLNLKLARNASVMHAADSWVHMPRIKQWRQQAAPPTLQQIYRDQCLGDPWAVQVIGASLRPGRAWVHEQRAWVPLLASDGDYFGLGLSFVLENGQWRLTVQVDQRDHIQVRHPAHRNLWQSLASTPAAVQSCENEPSLPPPPEPTDVDLDAAYSELEERINDPTNVWGYLQRQAIRYYAGVRNKGASLPPAAASASAQALWAQALYSSLAFDNAPEYASPAWDQRLATAMNYANRSMQTGMDAQAFAPISLVLARRHLFHPDLPQRDAALQALVPALAAANPDAQILQALILASPAGEHSVVCNAAVEGLIQAAAADVSEDRSYQRARRLLVAARIDLDCADRGARQPRRALQQLQAVQSEQVPSDAKSLVALHAHAQCLLSESVECVLPREMSIAGVWGEQAERREILESINLLPALNPVVWDCEQ